jgi:hypothetical protein
MIGRSKLALVGAVSAASRTGAAYIRDLYSLLFTIVERLYDAHARKVQMRLAPTKSLH